MRALEKEEIIVAQQRDFQKRKSEAKHPRNRSSDDEDRYQEIVAEKKGKFIRHPQPGTPQLTFCS